MSGRFRARLHGVDGGWALDRRPVAEHPLDLDGAASVATIPRHSIQLAVAREEDMMLAEPVFDDPLRSGISKDVDASPGLPVKSKASRPGTMESILDKQMEEAAADWNAYKLTLLQRFGTTNISSFLAKDYKAVATTTHLQQLEEPEKKAYEDFKVVTQQECVTQLKELNEEISEAWRNDERVSALRLTTKVARLLMDTSVPQFYPTLFILVTDVLDNVGELVWKRIKTKAEVDEHGNHIKLPVNFSWTDIPQEARDTCNNWFSKIASIKELLPRIYLEIAILRCLQFLQRDTISAIQRLTLMIRGLGNPLMSAYAYVYLSRKGIALVPLETGYLLSGIHDFSKLLRKTMTLEHDEYLRQLQIQKQTYMALLEPMFSWVLHCIFKNTKQEEIQTILVSLCGRREKDAAKPLSVMVNYLLKQLPATFVANYAIELTRLAKSSFDVSMPQCASFITLGKKLSDCPPPRESRIQVLNDVWKTITNYTSLVDYVAVASAFADYILQYCSETELILVLRDLKEHLRMGNLDHSVLSSLEATAVAVINHYPDFKHVLGLEAFVDILDFFHGDFRLNVHKCILVSVSRNSILISDPVCRNFLFECAKTLHDSLDSFSGDDDLRQTARLVVRFIQLADYSRNREQQLEFLVECRAAFPSMDTVREEIVHSSHGIAFSAHKSSIDSHSSCNTAFVKSCITFAEITIPSITSISMRLHLYVATAEVALLNTLVSHGLNLLKSGILCVQDLRPEDANQESKVQSLLMKFCSFLVLVPADPEFGVLYFLRGIVNLLDSKPWLMKGAERVKILLGILLTVSTLSQEELPYHVANDQVDSNDVLYFGETGYQEEMESFGAVILERISAVINQEKNARQQGYMLLDTCNTLLIAHENAAEMGLEMLTRAESLMPKKLAYLEATKQQFVKTKVSRC